jgi:hypothetical protein
MTRTRLFLAAILAHLFSPLNNLLTRYMGSAGLIAYASPNTLTNLIPTLYAAADIVSREQIGFIPAVTRDSRIDRVALNQTVNVPVVGAISPVSITPGAYAPDSGGATPGNVTVTISNQYAAPIAWNGDEQIAVSETGLYDSVVTQRFAQGMRAVANMVEADLAALHTKASRAYGTYNVQPFGTAADLSDMAQVIKILEDNGSPQTDLRAVLSSSAMANIRGKQSVLFKANEAGTDAMLRRGIVGDILGVGIGASAQVKTAVTAGTNNGSATTTAAGFAVGTTNIATAAAGTGTIVAGDIITFAGDTNKYVVVTGVANVASADTTLTIAEPGLRQAIPASATVITTIAATDRNMVFSKSAIVLATRTPYMPSGGDSASDVMDIVDPVSGLAFQVAMYKQYRQVHFEIGLAWGVKMIAPRHSALLIG